MAGPQVSTWTCRGLLASLKWSCSFHFLCNQPLYSLFAGMEQRKREKRNMVPGFGLLTHQYFLNSVTLQPASWSCRVWVSPLPLFTDHFLSLCLFLFYLSANFCLVQGNCVQIIMGFMLFFFFFCHYSVKCNQSRGIKSLDASLFHVPLSPLLPGQGPLACSHCPRLWAGTHSGLRSSRVF